MTRSDYFRLALSALDLGLEKGDDKLHLIRIFSQLDDDVTSLDRRYIARACEEVHKKLLEVNYNAD